MTIHLLRMAAGIDHLSELQDHIETHTRRDKKIGEFVSIHTRNSPKRASELLDGGSLYNVIRSVIQCRRRILDIRNIKDSEGKPMCEIRLEPKLIRVMPTAFKPFQGWRYFDPAKAPKDLGIYKSGDEPPAEMAEELRSLGLL